MKKDKKVIDLIEKRFDELREKIDDVNDKVDMIKEDYDKKRKKENVKKKHVLISEWRRNIQEDCEEKIKVSLEEEAEFFCKLTGNDICNIINCPKNRISEDED